MNEAAFRLYSHHVLLIATREHNQRDCSQGQQSRSCVDQHSDLLCCWE